MSTSTVFLLLSSLLISATADSSGGTITGGELWCVAKNNADDPSLQSALDWACGPGGADCGPIQEGGPCYEPADVQDHASYAFNYYYIHHGGSADACDFSGTAALTSLNPSQNNCSFPSSSSGNNGSYSGASTAGFGPGGAGLSGSAPVKLEAWIQVLATVLLMVVMGVGTGIDGGILR